MNTHSRIISENPFEVLNSRLGCIEQLLKQALERTAEQTIPEVGGVELAREITRLSKARIYCLVSERSIPHAKRGNKLYFNRAELLSWVAAGARGGKEGSRV